jgi:predicted DNA-binding transcriptional regulator AlpA
MKQTQRSTTSPVTAPRPVAVLNQKEAARYLGMSGTHLYRLEVAGKGPVRMRGTGRGARYAVTMLDAWIAAHSS